MLRNRFSQKLSKVVAQFLVHRCTVVTYTEIPDVTDERGNPTYDTVNFLDVHCLFLWQEKETANEIGVSILKLPILYVSNTETLIEGSIIKDVVDEDGATILLKTAKVKTIDSTAEGGNAVLKVCGLEGAVV